MLKLVFSMKIIRLLFFRFYSFLLIIATMGLVSCERVIEDDPKSEESKPVCLSASLVEETHSDTCTVLDENGYTVLWTPHDKIKVFTKQEMAGALFESTNTIPSKSADFEGFLDVSSISCENPIYAVYPFSDDASFDGTTIITSLASEQEAVVDGFQDHLIPSVAVSSDTHLSFYQIATGIRFFISKEGVKTVIFRGNEGETVSGSFMVSMDENGRPEVSDIVDGRQWVSLVAPASGAFEVGKMYYLSVLPQDFEKGFTLTFLTETEVARFEFNKNISFKRAIWENCKGLEEGITYCERHLSNGLPIVEVDVEDYASVDSKETWVNCKVRIGKDYYDTIVSNGKIRGRGNATWRDYPKKPYRIKLSAKEAPFGFPANKDWVLLAEFNDKSFLRLPYMCEVSKAAGAQYTVNYQHVNLYLNGEYQGLYVLTDQVKVGKNRVNIEDDGFLIEEDRYYYKEPLWFTTVAGFNFSFKYPDADDGEIVSGDDNFTFITGFFADLETALVNIAESPDAVSSKVDYTSFAKWYLIQELIGNWEPNRFYVLDSRSSKLKMYPAWDPEWSMGLAKNGNPNHSAGWYFPPELPDNEAVIWRERQYFTWLFKDPAFIHMLKDEWNLMKPNLDSVTDVINSVKTEISLAQKDNFDKWQTMGECYGAALVAFGSWEEEVDYVESFFANRIVWMDNYINGL